MPVEKPMKFLANRKLASRIGIITTVITFAGMLLLWVIVSGRIASMVESNITNQLVDAVESRASSNRLRDFPAHCNAKKSCQGMGL